MPQVIITCSAQERTDCLTRLKELGWVALDEDFSYNAAPHIKLLDDKVYQTMTEDALGPTHKQISANRFLCENPADETFTLTEVKDIAIAFKESSLDFDSFFKEYKNRK